MTVVGNVSEMYVVSLPAGQSHSVCVCVCWGGLYHLDLSVLSSSEQGHGKSSVVEISGSVQIALALFAMIYLFFFFLDMTTNRSLQLNMRWEKFISTSCWRLAYFVKVIVFMLRQL